MKEKTNISSHVIDALKEVIKDFLIVVFVITVPLFIYLKIGISIDKFAFHNYKVEGLYIKLDKKFILKAKKIHIPKTKAKPSVGTLKNTLNNIKNILNYIQYLELKKVVFDNNMFDIMYADNVFFIASNDYKLSAILHKKQHFIYADITNLYIAKHQLDCNATAFYDISQDKFDLDMDFVSKDINGTLTLAKKHNDISFFVTTKDFKDIKKLLSSYPIPPSIKVWITDNVKALRYKLDYLYMKFYLDNKHNLHLNPQSIDAKAYLYDTNITFHPKVHPVMTKKLTISYNKNTLFFDMLKPKYFDTLLDGSSVTISNLVGIKPSVLVVDILSFGKFDRYIQDILKAYDIHIPIRTTYRFNAHTTIDIPLAANSKVEVDSNASLKDGILYIGDIPLSTKSGDVIYQKKSITLKDIHLKNRYYNLSANGVIDLDKSLVKLDTKVKYIKLISEQTKSKIFHLTNKNLPVKISYKKAIDIDIAPLKTNIRYDNSLKIWLNSLKSIKPYTDLIPQFIKKGKVSIYTKDYQNYHFNSKVLWDNSCFYKNKSYIKSVDIQGDISHSNIKLKAFNNRVVYVMHKNLLKIKDIDIDMKKLLEIKSKSSNISKKIIIQGDRSSLKYEKHKLLTDSYDITIFPNGNIKAIGSFENDIIKFSKKLNNISIRAYRVKDKLLHALLGFDGLKHGRYTFKLDGDLDKELEGQVLVEGGILSDFKAYNNTLAFINTIPALATLSDPGFSQKGYEIQEGMILYHKKRQNIYLDSIYIRGLSGSIAGKGMIDLKTHILDIDLAVEVAKDFSKILGNIPIVGYILMGGDKSMTIGMHIEGVYEEPKVKTSVTKDILTLPIEMLKRTFGG